MPDGMIINQKAESDPDDPDWNGYYKIYYFEAPDSWFENAQYKDEGYEIGFYCYLGDTYTNGAWPGEPAKSLADFKIDYFKRMNPTATAEEIAAETAKIEAQFGNIYYAITKSYIPFIIWNNGINGGLPIDPDFDLNKANAARQTEDINVEDSFYNTLGATAEGEGDGEGITDLCGCITYVVGEKSVENPLTGITQTVGTVNWKFYEPKTGAMTDVGLLDENGELIYWDVDGFDEAQNPYYDMDYTFVPKVENPVIPEKPTDAPTDAPTDEPTKTPSGTPGGSTTGTGTSNTTNTNKGTVKTSESTAVLAIVAVILMAGVGVAFVSRRRKTTEK